MKSKQKTNIYLLGFPIVTEVNAGLEFHFQFPRIFLFVVLTNVKWRFNKERKKGTSDQLTKSKPKQIFNLKWRICFLWIKSINFFQYVDCSNFYINDDRATPSCKNWTIYCKWSATVGCMGLGLLIISTFLYSVRVITCTLHYFF